MDSPHSQRPLELILARNFLTSLSTPAMLVDNDGAVVFYNEAAGALLGVAFEEAGRLPAEQWGKAFGPFDEEGEPIHFEELPTTQALRAGRPAHGEYRIRTVTGGEHGIEVSALPIVATDELRGAMIVFWPRDGSEPR